ncbi:hypothetical protein ACFVGY_16345 [Streptomyces sp. NPDC127106]
MDVSHHPVRGLCTHALLYASPAAHTVVGVQLGVLTAHVEGDAW